MTCEEDEKDLFYVIQLSKNAPSFTTTVFNLATFIEKTLDFTIFFFGVDYPNAYSHYLKV